MERIKTTCLIALLIVWVGLLVFRFLTSPEPQHVPLKYISRQKGSPRAAVIVAPKPSLARWPAIHRPELPSQTPKNIFAPLPGSKKRGQARLRRASPLAKATSASPSPPKPMVYVPQPSPPPPPPPSPEEVAAEQAKRQREAAIQQARQQMSQYRFLGYVSENGEAKAFVGKGQDLFIVRNGEVLEGQVVISQIDGKSVTLGVPTLALTNKLELPKD